MSETINTNNDNTAPETHPDNIRVLQPAAKSSLGPFNSIEELDQDIADYFFCRYDPGIPDYPTTWEVQKLEMYLYEVGVENPEEAIARFFRNPPEWMQEVWNSTDDSFYDFDYDALYEVEALTNDASESFNQPDDGKPPMYCLSEFRDALPRLADELIQGILRVGHKMLIAGPSKAGKTFLLMYLAIAIAEGIDWLKFRCKKGKVLYINLEIDDASAIHRMYAIYDALGIPPKNDGNVVIWNLRGHAEPMDQLVPTILHRLRNRHFDAIIIDPIYKVIMGDENTATDMGKFCNEFDKLCTELGCSVIMCHHHSKGAQGGKKSMDRSSGSGVFARDPDAILDIIELDMPEELKDIIAELIASLHRRGAALDEPGGKGCGVLRGLLSISLLDVFFHGGEAEHPDAIIIVHHDVEQLMDSGVFQLGQVICQHIFPVISHNGIAIFVPEGKFTGVQKENIAQAGLLRVLLVRPYITVHSAHGSGLRIFVGRISVLVTLYIVDIQADVLPQPAGSGGFPEAGETLQQKVHRLGFETVDHYVRQILKRIGGYLLLCRLRTVEVDELPLRERCSGQNCQHQCDACHQPPCLLPHFHLPSFPPRVLCCGYPLAAQPEVPYCAGDKLIFVTL